MPSSVSLPGRPWGILLQKCKPSLWTRHSGLTREGTRDTRLTWRGGSCRASSSPGLPSCWGGERSHQPQRLQSYLRCCANMHPLAQHLACGSPRCAQERLREAWGRGSVITACGGLALPSPTTLLPPCAARGPEREAVSTCAIWNVRSEVEDSLQELLSGWGSLPHGNPVARRCATGKSFLSPRDHATGTALGLALSSVLHEHEITTDLSLSLLRPWEPQLPAGSGWRPAAVGSF